jgi:hypothetical protein
VICCTCGSTQLGIPSRSICSPASILPAGGPVDPCAVP